MSSRKTASRTGKKTAHADWVEIRRRMEAARAAIERTGRLSPEQAARVLQARAEALAREPERATTGEALEVVEFLLAHERYVVESQYIREVCSLENLAPLPCTPAFVLGVINLRGEILSVLDLKKFFELPEKGLTDLNKALVLQSGEMCFGILADAIAGVRRVPLADLQPSLPTLTGIREEYFKGVTADRLVVLDAAKLLASPRILVQEEVSV